MILSQIFLIVGIMLLLVFAYLFFLAVVSLWPEKKNNLIAPRFKFAVIIPAHNESRLIGRTLEQLELLDYPRDLYEVVVVADNCDDNTAEIARTRGVTCLERCDPLNQGKGNVLRWVFPRLLESGDHDGYVVIDADTFPAPDFLRVVNTYFCRDALVVQGYSQARHPDRSPLESLAFLGFALNRNLRYRGRSRLGWTTNLLGTGMCFQRKVMEQYGWNTVSMVEDIEYEMFLHLHDIRVTFAPAARLSVELHKGIQQSHGQRTRWDMGKFEIRNKYLPRLLMAGIKKRDISYFDSSMELILPPFSFFCIFTLLFCAFFFIFVRQGINLNFYIWSAVLICLILYVLTGLVSAKADFKVYRALMFAPFFIVWRVWIVLLESLKVNKQRQW